MISIILVWIPWPTSALAAWLLLAPLVLAADLARRIGRHRRPG